MEDFDQRSLEVYKSFFETLRLKEAGEITSQQAADNLRAIKERADILGIPLKLDGLVIDDGSASEDWWASDSEYVPGGFGEIESSSDDWDDASE